MARCTRTNSRRRSACVGALDQRITLQSRAITPPVFGSPDFDEAFSGAAARWASVSTVRGKTFFDGVNTAGGELVRDITHEVIIRYDTTVDAEVWVLLSDGRRLDILDTEDLDERHEWLVLTCTDKGVSKL